MLIERILHRLHNRVRTLEPHPAYQAWASTYDQRENNALLYAEERAFIPLLDSVNLRDKNVIDFGCGTGRHLSRCLGRNALSITGIDISREMLARALHKASTSERFMLLEASIDSLPFRDACFDVGIATLVLSHCARLEAPIAEMSRVLRHGATLLVSDWHPENDRRGWRRIFEVPSADGPGVRYSVQSYSHSLSEYRDQFLKCGFLVEDVHEPMIDESLEPIFKRTNMMHVYHQYHGSPVVAVFALRKT
jgi:malonyl-CoA O-methyltransferase